MQKLTLSVDGEVVERAKEYAARQGTSVSRLVESYLDALTRPKSALPELDWSKAPILAKLRKDLAGMKVGDDPREEYRAHLVKKYL